MQLCLSDVVHVSHVVPNNGMDDIVLQYALLGVFREYMVVLSVLRSGSRWKLACGVLALGPHVYADGRNTVVQCSKYCTSR